MLETEQPPYVGNFIQGLREIGYTVETAIADLVDNSITANAKKISIQFIPGSNVPTLTILDDGYGMTSEELKEAMRLGTKNPLNIREKGDLGRYGLGLKTASFSQCNTLTVATKKNGLTSVEQWDLKKVTRTNKWILTSYEFNEIKKLISEGVSSNFEELESGTLVIWSDIDKISNEEIPDTYDEIKNHVSMVFNRFLDGSCGTEKIQLSFNGNAIKGFDPLIKSHKKTINEEETILKHSNGEKEVRVMACILPSHKHVDPETYAINATSEGYTKSQGCYLYRSNRLIAAGTWFNLIARHDSHNLVRLEIDIDNNQDKEWTVSVTKSGFSVKPPEGIKKDLKGIFTSANRTGRGVIGGRRRVNSNIEKAFWNKVKNDEGKFSFVINKEHPIYQNLFKSLDDAQKEMFGIYIKYLNNYLPIDDINRAKIHTPKDIDTKPEYIDKETLREFTEHMLLKGLTREEIENFIKDMKQSQGLDVEEILNE